MQENAELLQLIKTYPAIIHIVNFRGNISDFYTQMASEIERQNLSTKQGQICNDLNLENKKKASITAILNYVKTIFTTEECLSIEKCLFKQYTISSAEHLSSITHPETLNVVLNQYLIQKQTQQPLITLACSTVSMANELYPRGLFYEEFKIPFLPSSLQRRFVINAPPLRNEIFVQHIHSLIQSRALKAQDQDIIFNWFDQIKSDLQFRKNLHEQIALINKDLWRRFLHADLIYPGMNYFMIPAEKCSVEFLKLEASASSSQRSWVFQSIFDSAYRFELLKVFDGIRACWDLKKNKGTFLFWGFGPKGNPLPLENKDGVLMSKDKHIQIELTPDSVINALDKGKIIPSFTLFLLQFVFYAGLRCLGGILQVNYLTEMKNCLINSTFPILSEIEKLNILSIPTNLYVNFQSNQWTRSGLKKIEKKLTYDSLLEYGRQNHFNQIQECLDFLKNLKV